MSDPDTTGPVTDVEAPKLSQPTNVATPKLTQPSVPAPRRKPPRWPRVVLRWIRRVLVGVLGLAVVSVAAVVVILHTDWGRDLLRRQIEAQLQARFPGGAKIGKLEGSVFGELVVRDIELDGRDGKPMVTVPTLRVEVELAALFEAKVRATSVVASGVDIDIHPQPPAPVEPAEPAPPEETTAASAWRVELPQIKVRDAHVVVASETGQVELTHGRADAAFTLPRRGPMRLEASVNAGWLGRPVLAVALARYGAGELEVPYAALIGTDADDPEAAPGRPSVSITAVDVHLGGDRGITGAITVRATAHAAATIAPIDAAMVPGDVFALVDGDGDRVGLDATVGLSRVVARGRVDLQTLTWRGIAGLTSQDLTNLTHGAVSGRGTVAIAATASPKVVRGILGVAGAVEEPIESQVTLAFDGAPDRAEVIAVAERGGGNAPAAVSHATITAEVTRKAGAMTLTRARITAVARDIPGVRGTVFVDADARGTLLPVTALSVDAEVDGEHVGYGATSIAGVQAHVTGYAVSRAPQAPAVPGRAAPSVGGAQQQLTGHLRLTATDVRSGAARLPEATVEADVAMAADGTLTFDKVVHQLRTGAGVWSGSGGSVRLSLGAAQPKLDVRGLHTGTGASNLTIATATMTPATGDLAATITAQDVAVAAALPGQPGAVDATVDVARRHGVWSGKLHVDARGVGTTELPVDGQLDVAVKGRTLAIAVHGAQAKLGDASLTVDIAGPPDLADVAAWQRLTRRAISHADLAIRGDGAALGIPGHVTGALAIVAGDVTGTLHVDGLQAGRETAIADVTLAAGSGDELVADAVATVSGVIAPHAEVRVAMPQHIFDPAMWTSLDRTILRGAVVHVDDTALDHPTLLALGVDTPYTAHVTAEVDVDAGARSVHAITRLSQLLGGAIVKPLAVDVTAGLDDQGGRGEVVVASGPQTLFDASGTTPLTIDGAIAGGAPAAGLGATLSTPDLSAADVLAIVGRTGVTRGTLHAGIDVGGTLLAPTGNAEVTISNLVLAPILAGQKPSELARLDLQAAWGGAAGQITVTAHEASGGELAAKLTGRPDKPTEGEATLDATAFDIAPVVAFLPGTLAAMTGTVTKAHLSYDPSARKLAGNATLAHTSIPLSAQLGTFRDAGVDIAVDNDHIHGVVSGKLGEGTVNADATLAMAGFAPKTIDATATLDNVSPLGAIRPKVHAKIKAALAYGASDGKWTGKVDVDEATATVSLKFADALFPIGQPDDIRFTDAAWQAPAAKDVHIPMPSAAWLDVKIALAPMNIEVHDPGSHGKIVDLKSSLTGILGVAHATVETTSDRLELTYGDDGIGLNGKIVTDTGRVDLVSRPYDIEVGELSFDGSIYPNVNIRLSHSFPDLTLSVNVTGRLPSDFKVQPESDSGSYSNELLLGFLFGGDPGGDPANAAQDAGVGVAAGLASGFAGSTVNNGLTKLHVPIKVDVLRYSAASASSSAAVEVGKWLGASLYVAYRQHLDALPTENINEGALEYYIHFGPAWLRRFLVDSSVGDREYDSIDVLFRKRW